jgi:TRAP-type C4-dicarboxylate transport system permease small subunit
MKKLFELCLKAEQLLACTLLGLIAILVFWSAVARTVGRPINWASDFALLAFAWLTFLGADIVAKTGSLIRIDMFTNYFPKSIQKMLAVIFGAAMIVFLIVLIRYGFILVSRSWTRMFNTLNLSYAWCTLSVPVGSALLLTTMTDNLIRDIKKPSSEWGGGNL